MDELKTFNIIMDNPEDSQNTVAKAVEVLQSLPVAEQIYALKFLRMLKESWE